MAKAERVKLYNYLENNFDLSYGVPLKKFTTWKTGGPAEALVVIKSKKDFVKLFSILSEETIPYLLLGGGSNMLIGDNGFKGLVIKNEFDGIKMLGYQNGESGKTTSEAVRGEKKIRMKTLDFKSLDYDDTTNEKIKVRVNSGANLHHTIFYTIEMGATGLQWFAGIPGTVGGATYQNIHGGTRNLDTHILEIEVLVNGKIERLKHKDLNFKYGYSNLMKSKLPIVSTTFLLNTHNKKLAKQTAVEWIKQKVVQPKNSGGCVFTNLSKYQAKKAGLPITSVAYLIDQVLDLRGCKNGGMQIAPTHANFIQNNGNGTAKEVQELISLIKQKAYQKTGLRLKEEVNYIGSF